MKTYNTFDIMYPSLNMARRHLINIIETGEQQDNLLSARQEAKASYDAAWETWETFEKQFEENTMQKVMVWSITDSRKIAAFRQSNKTLLVPPKKEKPMIDTDNSIIEDGNGFRYVRDIELELLADGNRVYCMI